MQAIKTAIRQKWFWVCQNKPFWASILLTTITAAFIAVKPALVNGAPTDLPVRFWGMFLQLLGAYTVWVDLTKTAKDFGEGPSLRKTWEYLKSFFHKSQIVEASLSCNAITGASATARLSSAINPNQPLDIRMSQLERFAQNLDAELAGMQTQIITQKQELSKEMTKKAGELQNSIDSLRHQLKDALVGNYAVLRFGAIWLVVGIVLSSIAVEITNVFHLHQLPRLW